jgi:hypothetical protein
MCSGRGHEQTQDLCGLVAMHFGLEGIEPHVEPA